MTIPQLLRIFEEQERTRLQAMLDQAEAISHGVDALFGGKQYDSWRKSLHRILES